MHHMSTGSNAITKNRREIHNGFLHSEMGEK